MSRRVRRARPDDVARLPEIELAALRLFEDVRDELGLGSLGEVNRVEDLVVAQREARLWVAVDPADAPVGFALVDEVDGVVHLEELDVHPSHGKRGLGTALVHAVLDAARASGRRAVTLSTFRDVPWNAPFYRRLGFRVLDPVEYGPGLLAIAEAERAKGLAMDRRVMMRRDLA